MNTLNLLDCIAHGTTHEEFLANFNGDVNAAVEHLQKFYLEQLAEEGADAPSTDEFSKAVKAATRALSASIPSHKS